MKWGSFILSIIAGLAGAYYAFGPKRQIAWIIGGILIFTSGALFKRATQRK